LDQFANAKARQTTIENKYKEHRVGGKKDRKMPLCMWVTF